MRTSIVVAPIRGRSRPVLNLYGDTDALRLMIVDRRANGEAFPAEQIVRLPRRLGVDRCHCVSGQYIRPRRHSCGTINRNVD